MFLEHKTVYTIPQCRAGGRISGESRRYLVRGRHAQVRELHHAGHSNGMIARITGYHRSTVGRILRGLIRTCLTALETTTRAIAYPLWKAVTKATIDVKLFAQHPAKKRRRRRAGNAWNWIFWGKAPIAHKLKVLGLVFDELCKRNHWQPGIVVCPSCGQPSPYREYAGPSIGEVNHLLWAAITGRPEFWRA